MSTKWTTEQQHAIDVRNCNTLVSAAAGSGKTAVLVERVINMITDESNPVYVNQLLIATFTNAAASEMKERIYKSLQGKIRENPHNSYLREQLVLLGQAQISTIHSFCTNLIRENFHLLNIRHDFEIGDDVRISSLKKIAIDEIMEKYYIEGNTAFHNLVDSFGGKKNDDDLVGIIFAVYKYAESLSNPEEWLRKCHTNLDSIDFVDSLKKFIVNSQNAILNDIIKEYSIALDIIENDSGLSGYFEAYSNELNFFKTMLVKNDDVIKAVESFKFGSLKPKKKNTDPNNHIVVKKIRENAKELFEQIKDLYSYNDMFVETEIKLMLPYIQTICNLVIEFKEKFSNLKKSENLLDFNDLEHFSIKLLIENEDIINYYKSTYKEILVDEYQDTNGVQAYLFELLSNGNNLFMVGDVKQSIYGFRNSNPKYFIEKYNTYSSEQSKNCKIILSKNFRSSNVILRTINCFFNNIMMKELGGIDYCNGHSLIYGNETIKDIDKPIERYIINKKKADNIGLEDFGEDKNKAEAIFVADKIYNLVEVEKQQIYDNNTNSYRQITYKDIVILMRKTKNTAALYADVLGERGIPVYTAESGGYFNSVEIATVLSFLKVIQNPLQDIPLLSIMRSPIYGFDDNLIAEIRSENSNTYLYNVLKSSKNKKAKEFITIIEKFIDYAKYNNVGAVVRKIVYDTGYYHFVGGLENGTIKMLNLSLLCERADEFSANSYKNVSNFILYINNMLESETQYSAPKLISENDNVVTIMSIHKSKGLEFPVVFLCETGKGINKRDLSDNYIYDEELGLSINIIDIRRHLKYTPYIKKAFAFKKTFDIIAEEIRLLYVALTRAKYKLIVTATSTVNGDFYTEKNITPSDIFLYKNYIGMLLLNINGIPSPEIYNAVDILSKDKTINKTTDDLPKTNNYSYLYEEIASILDYEYAYKNSRAIPSKKSISEMIDEDISLIKISNGDSKITPAQRGTLIHFILQNIELSDVSTIDDIKRQINNMISKGMFDSKSKNIIDTKAIYAFFESEIGKRMLNSKKILREFKFCVDFPAEELGYDSIDETVLIQGVIDCCFIENGEFVIIDYKTGSLKEKYKKQLELYRRCLEISTGINVKETFIYPLI